MFISGLQKTGGAGADDFAFGTDLGLQTNFQANSTEVAKVPAKGSVATLNTVSTGSNYSLGTGKVLVQTSTDGLGLGLKVKTNTKQDLGVMKVGSSVKNTAGFNGVQNNLAENLKFDSGTALAPYTYARVTSSADPFSGTSLIPLAGTSATGTAGTFTVTVNYGSVTKVTVAVAGTLYKVGDVVTITQATLEANASFTGTGGIVFQGDLTLLLTEENVLGSIAGFEGITILDGGVGHAVGDLIGLSEEGSAVVGNGAVTIGTLGIANTVITAPNNIYPRGIKTSTGSQAAPKTIEFVGLDDVNVIIGGFTAGTVLPLRFKEVIDAGTDELLGNLTILY
jgi:hypothetical protein|tara:strand:+ start:45 stop:1058 length:1014 start_codon:yes stop_codon:yes gene_type:complete